MLVIREITEDLYTAIEHEIVPGVVQSLKVVTEAACRRFFRFAFELARSKAARRSTASTRRTSSSWPTACSSKASAPDRQGLPGDHSPRRSSSTTAACSWCRGRSSSTCW